MKRMKYQVRGTVYCYHETAGVTVQKESVYELDEAWSEEAHARAEAVALGAVEIYDDGMQEPVQPGAVQNAATWEEMAAAIREGVNGVE